MAKPNEPTSSRPDAVFGPALSGEAVLDALKMILLGAPLAEVLTSLALLIEAQRPGMLCSIFLLDADGVHLRYGAAPSLPESYRIATDGMASGPNAGSCGTAVHLREPVFVSDILSDSRWVAFKDFTVAAGLRAAWSSPIISNDGRVLGTFGMYYGDARHPTASDIRLIDTRFDLAEQSFQNGSVHPGAGEPAVVIGLGQRDPSFTVSYAPTCDS